MSFNSRHKSNIVDFDCLAKSNLSTQLDFVYLRCFQAPWKENVFVF